MCHIVLAMPVIGLGVFWIWPIAIALPVYLVIITLSGLIYYALLKAMHQPVKTGRAGLLGSIATVVDPINKKGEVRVHGELWNAVSTEKIKKGAEVVIIAVDGTTLKVQKVTAKDKIKKQVKCPV